MAQLILWFLSTQQGGKTHAHLLCIISYDNTHCVNDVYRLQTIIVDHLRQTIQILIIC